MIGPGLFPGVSTDPEDREARSFDFGGMVRRMPPSGGDSRERRGGIEPRPPGRQRPGSGNGSRRRPLPRWTKSHGRRLDTRHRTAQPGPGSGAGPDTNSGRSTVGRSSGSAGGDRPARERRPPGRHSGAQRRGRRRPHSLSRQAGQGPPTSGQFSRWGPASSAGDGRNVQRRKCPARVPRRRDRLTFFRAMRTAIQLDDELFRRATRKAAEAGTTLSVLVQRALRAHLDSRSEIGGRPGSDVPATLAATFATAREAAVPGRDEWDRS